MLGNGLLVANIVEQSATKRKIYLPSVTIGMILYYAKVRWRAEIEISVNLSSIPLFIRDSVIIPLTKMKLVYRVDLFQSISNYLIGGESSEFQLYQDDGLTQEYKDGGYSETTITVLKSAEQTQINFKHSGKVTPKTQHLELELY